MHTTRISDAVSRVIYKDKIFRYPKSRSDALDIFYKTLFNMLTDPPKLIELKRKMKFDSRYKWSTDMLATDWQLVDEVAN